MVHSVRENICLFLLSVFPLCLFFSPAHEVVLAALVLVPHGDLELLRLVLEEVQVELLLPTGVQRLVDRLGLVPLVAQSGKC